jgi:radical SAM superfamily enzyme YgiQ (UPF0313 family)
VTSSGQSGTARVEGRSPNARVSRVLVVAVNPGGVRVPSYAAEPELPIGLPHLELVTALAGDEPTETAVDRISAATGEPRDELEAFLAELDRLDLLVDRASPRRPDPGPAPSGTTRPVPDGPLVMTTPTLFRVTVEGMEHIAHDGRLLTRLAPIELVAASQFRVPVTLENARQLHREALGERALDPAAFDALVAVLCGVDLVQAFDPENPSHDRNTRNMEQLRDALGRQGRIKQAIERAVQTDDAAEVDDAAHTDDDTGRARGRAGRITRVVPVDTTWQLPPAALGLLVAYAKAYDGGRLEERYHFHQRWFGEQPQFEAVAHEPGIFLFSNYLWNHEENLRLSAMVKRLRPESVTIHGGPDTPKYAADCERYFAANPHVDIAVRGEGEATFAEILDALGPLEAAPPDLAALADVPGLTFRSGRGVVRTPDRDRIENLDTIPSPLLTGLFDVYRAGPTKTIILETNRGCPYGCTFCDWGSATLSRIRKFDLDRVFGELEWCAENRIETISIGDANFGIFERDVDIAERIAELKSVHGFPKLVATNYAKNTVKHLRRIIEVFAEADIVAEGVVSLQTMDQDTLVTIRRKNIKVEKYNDLSGEFRRNGLPLAVDLMLGLPGSTFDSFRSDLQECVDRDVRVRIHPTQLLPNSPMNDPDYRRDHGITAVPGEYVEETNTFTRDEWHAMWRLAMTFLMGDLFGTLRQVAMFVRQETGLTEVEVYERLTDDVHADTDRWPALALVTRVVPALMVPPVSWQLFMDEVRAYLVDVVGIPSSDALDTVLAVQHSLLPAAGRAFPQLLALPHDYATWHRQVLEAREAGHRHDWQDIVPRLTELPPAPFSVDDPEDVCHFSVGQHMVTLSLTFASFELRSPVARPRIKMREPIGA